MATLALSRDLLSRFANLERRIQTKVNEIAGIFQRSTPQQLRDNKGIHLERYKDQRDSRARTIRITDNHRGIVCDLGNGETFVLHDILTHDEADQWMARNTFRVNSVTGALEIRDVEAIEAEIASVPTDIAVSQPLFNHRRDKDFTQLGIDKNLVPALRAFSTEDQLQGLLAVLPQSQAEALILLTGTDAVGTIYAEIAGDIEPATVDEEDLVAALGTPASQAMFRVLANEEELQEMLARPLAQWRTFLHPSQRGLAEKAVFNGPVRVTGGAGTGKTVVALHRARYLAGQLGDRAGKPILFTTFTRNLAESIEQNLRELGGTDLLDVVDVLNVDTLASRVVREQEGDAPVLQGRSLDDLWQEVADELGTTQRAEFLANEWEQVILAQGCHSRDEYLRASRAGRGVRLDRRGRMEVWKAVEALGQKLVDRKARTFLQLADAAAGYLQKRSVRPYRHVLVDEAQDLHEAQWRMLRAVVAESPNDLFIVGDSHQRIYDRRTSLSKVGISIVGRSRRLRINYRTTHEILRWAVALLGEEDYDDLDTGFETQELAGYHSFLHGPPPTTEGLPSKKAEYDALVKRIKTWVDLGVHPEDIAVATRTGNAFDAIEGALKTGGLPVCPIGSELPKADGVRLGTMHRLKGTEFRCVAVIDADDDTIPHPLALTDRSADPVQYESDLKRERCLLYVACTRARDDLWVAWSGKPSRLLQPILDSA